jgi:acetoin utilization deacetylase AcuC-like enzyme
MYVFYNSKQTAKTNTSFSPSAGKPAEVVASWQQLGLPIEIIDDFLPCTESDMEAAHDPVYVRGVLALKLTNGFGNTIPEVRDSLYWTTGSMLAAARFAAGMRQNTASPTSGFHHAGYDSGGGFCTFNGLMIAAINLLEDYEKVGILDCDCHYGDGTVDIIERLNLQHRVPHWTYAGGQGFPTTKHFLQKLPSLIRRTFKGCSVILYQAGADPHIDDPLGGKMTTQEMIQRDKIVFETAASMGIPVAWNLAGGYQSPLRKVLDIHDNTAIQCVEIEEKSHGKKTIK